MKPAGRFLERATHVGSRGRRHHASARLRGGPFVVIAGVASVPAAAIALGGTTCGHGAGCGLPARMFRDGPVRALATFGRAAYLDLCGGRSTVEEYNRRAAERNEHLLRYRIG